MDTRPKLDDLLSQWPIGLACACSHLEGPDQDCPEHGDITMFANMAQQTHYELLRMAHIVEDIRKLADSFSGGTKREREIGLEILQRLAQDVNLTPAPIYTPMDPWGPPLDPKDVPF